MMSIIICLGLGYLAAVAGVWVVIAIIWDPRAEYRELQSGLKAKGKCRQNGNAGLTEYDR